MKIIIFHLPSLRNNEFFRNTTRIHETVNQATPATLETEAVYAEFTALS